MTNYMLSCNKRLLSAKDAQYFEDTHCPEPKSTCPAENSKYGFPVNITLANKRDVLHNMPNNSENQANLAENEENKQKVILEDNMQPEGNNSHLKYHEFRTALDSNISENNLQFIQQHEGNPCNLNFTPPSKPVLVNTMCSMMNNANATMIQSAYSVLCPFSNFNIISIPHFHHFIPLYPHYILFQPLLEIHQSLQTVPCKNCQLRMVHCHNQCMSCYSQRVPAKTKELIKEISSRNAHNNRLDLKKEQYGGKSTSASVLQKQKKKCSENIISNTKPEIPHLSPIENVLAIKPGSLKESEYSCSQSFQDWYRNSALTVEHQSLERNAEAEYIDSLENSNDEIPKIRYLNHHFPHANPRVHENHKTNLKNKIKCDDIRWKKNQRKQSYGRTSDFRKGADEFPCSTIHYKPLTQQLDHRNILKNIKISENSHKLQKVPDKNDSQELNAKATVIQKYDHSEDLSTCSLNKMNSKRKFSKDKFDFIPDGTVSSDVGDKRNFDLDKREFAKSNICEKLLAERPVIFQNGIQEMNITISNEDKNGKEDSECKYHPCKHTNKVCCPPIKGKKYKSIQLLKNQLEPEETKQIRESITSYPPLYLENTKAIINSVLKQLQENRENYRGESNSAQNLHLERNTSNTHIDLYQQRYMKITDDGKCIADYNDKQRPSISGRNQMNQKNEENVSNKSLQLSSSTTLKQAHFVRYDKKFSLEDFDYESGIDTD